VDDEEPPELDADTAEPPKFGEARDSVLTPEGQIQSVGSFARGLALASSRSPSSR